MTDLLQGPVRPIHDKRQVNLAGLWLKLAPDPRHIGLFRLSFFKLQPQMTLCMRGERKDHHTRGVAIQSMHQKRLRISILHPRQKAIGQMLALAGYGQ